MLNGRGERFARNVREPITEFLISDVICPVATDPVPTIDPGTTEGAITIKDKQ